MEQRISDSMKYLRSSDYVDDFNEKLKKKYDIKQQEADTQRANQIATAPMYAAQANMLNGVNQMHKDVAGMQYGPGGSVDRSILAQQPLRDAQAGYYDTMTNEGKFKMGVAQETRPALIADINATRGLNTVTNQTTADNAGWDSYNKSKARVATMPAYDEPYQKSTPFETRGFFKKLWAGDLYNPFSEKNALEETEAAKIKKMNQSYYKLNPLAQPR